jgi:O-antigen ligase
VRYVAIAIAVALAVFTALAMANAPAFVTQTLVSLGFIDVTPTDLLLGFGVLALLGVSAFQFRRESAPLNRLVLSLCLVYIGYQFLVVLPAAVLLHGSSPIQVLRLLEYRFDLVLVLVVYAVVLRFTSPQLLLTVIDIAAAGLALWIIYRYASGGATGYWEGGVFRLRVAWGGSSLLLGWLVLSSLFYWRMSVWRILLAMLGAAALTLTNHRSGILALIVACGVQMLAAGRVTRRIAVILLVAVVTGVAVYYASPAVRDSVTYSLRTMIDANADVTAQDRVVRSRMALDYFAEHPLGDYIWNGRFYTVTVAYDFPPHNFVVQRLVTQGVIAGSLFFAVIGVTVAVAWRNRRDHLTAFALAYLALYLAFCFLNANIDLLENQALFAVAMGVILHQNRVRAEQEAVEPALPGALDALPARAGARA